MAVLQNVETRLYVDSDWMTTAVGVFRQAQQSNAPTDAPLAAGDSPHLLHLSIATPIPAMIRFSAKLTSPRGVLELPPTQAQLSAM